MAKNHRTGKRTKRSGATPSDKVLRDLRAAIGNASARGAHGSRKGLNVFREHLAVNAVSNAVRVMASHPAYKSAIWPNPFPKSWEETSNVGYESYLEFPKEYLWVSNALMVYARHINEFFYLKLKFDSALLIGELNDADQILTDVHEKFGVSIWWAESRIALIQRIHGFKAQKAFQNVITKTAKSSIVNFVVPWIGFKFEENTSYAQLIRMIERFAGRKFGVYYLLRLYFGDFVSLDETMAAHTLSHADTLPVIDRYLIFIKVTQALIASNAGDTAIIDVIRQGITPLCAEINDASLRRINFICNDGAALNQVPDELMQVLDCYTKGDYESVRNLSVDYLGGTPTSVAAMDLLRRATNALGDKSAYDGGDGSGPIQSEINDCLFEIIRFGPKAIEKRQRLQKIGLIYANNSWGPSVQRLAPPEPTTGTFFQRDRYLALKTIEDHPLLVSSLRNIVKPERYLASIDRGRGVTSTLMSIAYGSEANVSDIDKMPIPLIRRDRYKAIALVSRGRTADALPLLFSLFQGAVTTLDRLEVGELLVASLIEENELGQAAKVAASLLLETPYFASILPLSQLVSAIVRAQEEGDLKGARGDLSVATVADMYARYIATDQEAARSDAYKDFLRFNGVKRPSELSTRVGDFPHAEIVYFLRYVCVPEVMDQSLALPSTKAVEDERVAVLLMLSDLTSQQDRETQLAYLEELREIRTRQVVRDTNKRLEQSKIFVNVEGIKKRVDASISDNWDRYRVLSMQNDDGSIVDEVRKLIEKRSGGKVIALPLSMPATERNKLFAQMLYEIRDLFVDSKEFGLDANLSANIRHGYVLREIRRPLLAQNLITNRPSLDQPYEENSVWAARLQLLSADEGARLQDALSAFSAEVDRKIDDLNSKILRVKSPALPDGIFDFSFTNAEVGYLQRKTAEIISHEEFIETVIDYFWQATQFNLEAARKFLEEHAAQGFSEALDGLDAQLEAVAPSYKLTALRSAITLSRPEVQAAVGRVSSWFTLSTEVDFPDYSVETAYQAGIETIKSYAVHAKILSSLDNDKNIMLRGRTLPFIGRILFIILDNIVEHSQLASGEIPIRCSIRLEDGDLIFRVTNGLAETVDLDQAKRRAEDVNDLYGTEKATQFISVERRSGYPKIWKILTHDLQVEHSLEVSVDNDAREFTVEILMAAARLAV